MVILDTSIIIDHLRQAGKKSSLDKLVEQAPKQSLAISTITIQELYEGTSTRDESKEKDLLVVISPLRILPYSYDIAKLAGEIIRDQKPNLGFADVAIAATVIFNEAQFLTLNKKDFEGIENLLLWE